METFSETPLKALMLFLVQVACNQLSFAPYILNFNARDFFWPIGMDHESKNEKRINEVLLLGFYMSKTGIDYFVLSNCQF